MTAKPRPVHSPRATVHVSRVSIVRQNIAHVFVQCLAETDTSQNRAARELQLTRRTVGAWAKGESPVSLERVLASAKLGKVFRRLLCSEEHASRVAYLAKKAGR